MKLLSRLLIFLLAASCFGLSLAQSKTYSIAMLPVSSTATMQAFLDALGNYLAGYLGSDVRIETRLAKDFDSYLSMVRQGQVDLAFSNPYFYLKFEDLHQALAVADRGEGPRMQGLIVVRQDSPLQTIFDLTDKTISAVHPESLGGYIAPLTLLLEKNIKVKQVEFVADNRHENVLFSVHYGDSDAGFVASFSLESAKNYLPPNSLRVLARSEFVPSWIFSANNKIPDKEKMLLRQALLVMSADHPAMRVGKLKSFTAVNSIELNNLRRLKANYERLR
jgi:phosphonate transport system substrate-binding protein